MLAGFGIMVLTILAMEGVAWLMHKYVLHGFLWFLHKSHHTPNAGIFERNDLVFGFYGLLAMLFFIYGSEKMDYRFWIGCGISVYGAVYFLVHDIFIHRRIKLFKKTSNIYLRALDIAHKVHHKTHTQHGSESFGMLWVNPKFLKLARRKTSPQLQN